MVAAISIHRVPVITLLTRKRMHNPVPAKLHLTQRIATVIPLPVPVIAFFTQCA
jgi:hypothetical protein